MPKLEEILSETRVCYYCGGGIPAGRPAYHDRRTGNYWHTDRRACLPSPPAASSVGQGGPKPEQVRSALQDAPAAAQPYVFVGGWVPAAQAVAISKAIVEARA